MGLSSPVVVGKELHSAYLRRSRFLNLDGVRALSIAGVLLVHFTHGYSLLPMLTRGFLGVDMFFVLSGFLIVTLLLRERDRNGKVSLKAFYLRRVLRIFPLYYLLVLLVGVVAFVADRPAFDWDKYQRAIPYLLTYTSNWSHEDPMILDVAWSLATEEQFYMVWPLIIAFLPERGAQAALLFGLGVNFLMPQTIESHGLKILETTFFPILLGVGIAHLLHNPRGFAWAYKGFGHRYSTLVFGGLLLGVLNIPNPDIVGLHRNAIHLCMAAWLTTLVVQEDGHGQGFLKNPVMVRAGVVSYGLYLWHMVALTISMRFIEERGLLLLLVATPITYLLAELSFRFYESPFLRLKSRFQT